MNVSINPPFNDPYTHVFAEGLPVAVSPPEVKEKPAEERTVSLPNENPLTGVDNRQPITPELLKYDFYRRCLALGKKEQGSAISMEVRTTHLRTLVNTLPIDPIKISEDLIQNLKKLSPAETLDPLLNDLQTLLNAISSITDKASLTALSTNIEVFDQVRGEKAQSGADWDSLQDLVMSIQTTLIGQQAKLPDEDMRALVEKMQSQMQEMLRKLDQLSPEQISALNRTMISLQKVIDGMSSDFKAMLEQEIANVSTKILERVQALFTEKAAQAFQLTLLDYLEEKDGDRSFHQLLGDLQDIADEKQRTDIALLMVMNYFSMENFPKWMRFLKGVEEGISIDLTRIVEPNPVLANKIRQTYLDMIHQKNILTVILAQDTYLPIFTDMTTNHWVRVNNFNPDNPPTIRWNTPSGIVEEGIITSVENDVTGEGVWYNYGVKKKDGQAVKFQNCMHWDDDGPSYDAIVDHVKISDSSHNVFVNNPSNGGIIAFNHFMMRQVGEQESEAYLSNAPQLLQDLSDAVESSMRHADLKNLMGHRFFSHPEIENGFGIQTLSPLLPPTLTREMLSSPCPYEANKKIFETHFLFFMPYYMKEKDLSWKSFITNYSCPLMRKSWGSFSIKEANLIVDGRVYLGGDSAGEKWVLLYTSGAAKKDDNYRKASLNELLTALSFWRAREQDPLFLFNLMPLPPLRSIKNLCTNDPRKMLDLNRVYNFDNFFNIYSDNVTGEGLWVTPPFEGAGIFITVDLNGAHQILVRNLG